MKFGENQCIESRVVPSGRTDRETDMTKLTGAFRNFANAPKNRWWLILLPLVNPPVLSGLRELLNLTYTNRTSGGNNRAKAPEFICFAHVLQLVNLYFMDVYENLLFLGAFAKLRKAIIVLSCPSVRPPSRMEQHGSHWTDFREI
jgi:hypothetical protein